MISNGFFISLIFLMVLLNSALITYAQDVNKTHEASVLDDFYLCKRDKSIRWLRAYSLENGKCNTFYSKEGYLQVVGSATYNSSCEGILLSVKKNIEEGGFVCSLIDKHSVLEL